MYDSLILVDENDNEIGMLDKTSVHQKGSSPGLLCFYFNSTGGLLIQQRPEEKYHSAWMKICLPKVL